MELPSLHPICPFFGFLFNVLDLSKASLPLHLAILGTKHPMSKPMETYWLRNDFLIKPSWKKKKEEFIHKPVRGRVTLETGTKLGMSGVNMLVNMGNSQMARYKKKNQKTHLYTTWFNMKLKTGMHFKVLVWFWEPQHAVSTFAFWLPVYGQ